MGTQPDGGGEPVGAVHHVFHHFLFLVADIEKGPGGNGDQQYNTHQQDQFGGQAVAQVVNSFEHKALSGISNVKIQMPN